MIIKHLIFILLILNFSDSFIYNQIINNKIKAKKIMCHNSNHNTNQYLNNLNNNEIIDKNKNKNINKIERGIISTYEPIKKGTFDIIFVNIFQINKIYISSNNDRLIFEYNSTKRNVYYINNQDEYNKINQLIKLIPHDIKFIIICDVKNTMDDVFGYLYCEPK
jgi:hypothetical protein